MISYYLLVLVGSYVGNLQGGCWARLVIADIWSMGPVRRRREDKDKEKKEKNKEKENMENMDKEKEDKDKEKEDKDKERWVSPI